MQLRTAEARVWRCAARVFVGVCVARRRSGNGAASQLQTTVVHEMMTQDADALPTESTEGALQRMARLLSFAEGDHPCRDEAGQRHHSSLRLSVLRV